MNTIYILGAGAIGYPLAVYLAHAGQPVIAVRTSRGDLPPGPVVVSVQSGAERVSAAVETVSLSRLDRLDGMIVITSKSHANATIARQLVAKAARGPIVIMQNGVGVERPFVEAGFAPVYRGVLYITSQAIAEHVFSIRPVTASPVGVIAGDQAGLQACVAALTTAGFPLRGEENIQREIWKKAIINCVFNSICPLLDVDNGIFARDPEAAGLAGALVSECVLLTDRLGLGLGAEEIMAQIRLISARSDGQLISTLQDIRQGRPTEIGFLNLEIARVAAALQPGLDLPRIGLLGKMIELKSLQRSRSEL